MKKWLGITVFLLAMTLNLNAQKKADVTWKECRVNQLLPNLVSVPAVEFALPSHYEYVSLAELEKDSSSLDCGVYFWGPKKVIQKAFKNWDGKTDFKLNPEVPILSVEVSYDLAQLDADTFQGEEELKDIPNLTYEKFKWGNYPVLAIDYQDYGYSINAAYVGLNHSSSVLKITLHSPKGSEKTGLDFWNHFLKQTKPLGLLEAARSKGQDMQEGITTVKLADCYLKVFAERRVSDHKLKVMAVPCSDGISFDAQSILQLNASETNLNSIFDGELVKIKGALKTEGPSVKHQITSDQSINVMVKEVSKFSLDPSSKKSKAELIFSSKEN